MDTRSSYRTPVFCLLNYVPFKRITRLLFCQALLLLLSPHVNCYRNLLEPTSSYRLDSYDDTLQGNYFAPTPPLESVKNKANYQRAELNESLAGNSFSLNEADSMDGFFSPLFDFQVLAENYGLVVAPSRVHQRDLASKPVADDTGDMWINSLNGIEPGSGQMWDERHEIFPGDESTPSASIIPTSVFPIPDNHRQSESTPALDDSINNRAPILNRRLPKLSLVSGQIWKYNIPADTFIDEDGDLRALWSSVFIRTGADSLLPLSPTDEADNGSTSSLDKYFSWIQYNQTSRLLYGLPTEKNTGKHELVLVASDRWSATGRETIELHVKQHLSVRAFTHLVSVNRVEWERHKYPSIVDVLIRFIERLSERIFLTKNTRDFIIKSYTINDFSIQTPNDHETTAVVSNIATPTEKQTTSLSLNWSNSSLPVHPCDLNLLDGYLKHLLEGLVSVSSRSQPTTNLNPSPELVKAMYPDFTLSNISVDLRASCQDTTGFFSKLENSLYPSSDTNITRLKVRTKIGMLTWKLGEPIEYQITSDTFELEGKGNIKSIQMSLYTIDGLLLNKDPKYGFLEFDEETNTLYGMAYDIKQHSGQRELMLIGVHPDSGSRAREVFMLNIEPQDLTMINNRAFKMSLYFGMRVGEFGPQERILISHKIIQALRVASWHEYRLESPQFIVTDIQKFSISGDYGDFQDFSESQLARLARVSDEEAPPGKDGAGSQHKRYFYRFSWTNSSIGVRGDCPVEVIKENIFFALEQSMLDLEAPGEMHDDSTKNDSTRFYERLRLYFDPEFDLIHLRFEPLGACQDAIELHQVGNSEIADSVDKLMAAESATFDLYHQQQEPSLPHLQLGGPKIVVEPDSDEYWSIVVLIVLVMVLIFVIVMFFLGIHTYKINQDKKFELQVRLAQARHNSMYLSSMILANQATAGDICLATSNQEQIKNAKSMYVIQDDDNMKRAKPTVVLDNQLRVQQQLDMQHQATPGVVATKLPNGQLTNKTIIQHPFPLIKQGATLTQMQPEPWSVQQPSSSLMMEDKRLTMTLNRRFSNSIHQKLAASPMGPTMNHSQSILTVASMGCPVSLVSNVPVVYTQGAGYQPVMGHQPIAYLNPLHQPELMANESVKLYAQQHNKTPFVDPLGKSPSYSSSASGTTQSVIMNPYYNNTNG